LHGIVLVVLQLVGAALAVLLAFICADRLRAPLRSFLAAILDEEAAEAGATLSVALIVLGGLVAAVNVLSSAQFIGEYARALLSGSAQSVDTAFGMVRWVLGTAAVMYVAVNIGKLAGARGRSAPEPAATPAPGADEEGTHGA